MNAADAVQRERLRQQQLLRALWQRASDASLTGWLREAPPRAAQGLSAYRGNAAAIAERALSAAFPTVRELIGDESFAQLARVFWHREPPRCGDLARYGDGLADWIAHDKQLASEPYLADVARVDWAVHAIEHAADAAAAPVGLSLLAECEPSRLTLRLRPALTLVASRFPVVTIWHAHRRRDADRFVPVREAFANRVAETALVARPQWQAAVSVLDEATARFMRALQQGADLTRALDAAGAWFQFEPWLHDAVRQQWLQAVEPASHTSSGGMR
ncbi:MAG TPA: DNA-binding domain-containing protein [Burkholderiaceae bacterium]|nr:DNA-binding domain-containing protein [Burkholderiaceae bacterium]